MTECSPVVIFVYNRLDHTKKTVEALSQNELALSTCVYFYSDGPKSVEDENGVQKVRSYLRTINSFKKTTIIERDENFGLARNIVDGAGSIFEVYDRAIFLEDDIVTSPTFLTYMNNALEAYKEVKEVWHVSGWGFPIECEIDSEAFLWRVMICWGWATWRENWKSFEKNPQQLKKEFSLEDIRRFNLDGVHDFWHQVELNLSGQINSWAVFWYATIFKNEGLCVNPYISQVENIGHDGSGVNCGYTRKYRSVVAQYSHVTDFPVITTENVLAVDEIKKFYVKGRRNLLNRLLDKVFFKFSTSLSYVLHRK